MAMGLIIVRGPRAGSMFELREEIVVIGREEQSVDFAIVDPAISRRHARLSRQGNRYLIEDLKSSNGTFVNSKRISGPVLLAEGDVIDLGKAARLSYQSLETGEETVVMSDQESMTQIMAPPAGDIEAAVTPEHVLKAYAALASGDVEQIKEYWAEEMVWQVPGQNRLSGWYYGRDEFLGFMGEVGELSGRSFRMEPVAGQVLVTGDYSCDLTRNRGHRAGQPEKTMDIEVAHVLRWRDGKVIAGKGAIFGDGTTEYDQFWSESPFVTPPSQGRKEA
jgi:pSer/pThr/pTyr-binding forkhead associated (FHA) protein